MLHGAGVLTGTCALLDAAASGATADADVAGAAHGADSPDAASGDVTAMQGKLAKWQGRCRQLRLDMSAAASEASQQLATLQVLLRVVLCIR